MHDPLLLTALLAAARVAGEVARWRLTLRADRELGRLSRAAGPGSTVARRDRGGWLVIARGEGGE